MQTSLRRGSYRFMVVRFFFFALIPPTAMDDMGRGLVVTPPYYQAEKYRNVLLNSTIPFTIFLNPFKLPSMSDDKQTSPQPTNLGNYKEQTFTKLVNLVDIALDEQQYLLRYGDDPEIKQAAIDSVLDRAGLPRHKTVTTNAPQGADGQGGVLQPEVIEGLVKGLASVFGVKDVDDLQIPKSVGSNKQPSTTKPFLKDVI